jgi:LmbE family N-acetylglucosaminyl deacetylase
VFGRRILILVPHPDDEVVASAAAIGRAREAGAEIFALYLTHGCIAKEVMWMWQRKNYEKNVARRWAHRPARCLWQNMAAIHQEIQGAVSTYKIDQIWLPAYEGGNPDHDALNAVGQKLKGAASVLEFAEYNFCGGRAQTHTFPKPDGGEQVIELTEAERAMKRTALALYQSEKSNLKYVETERECFRPLAAYDYSRPPHPGKLWYARFQWVPFRHPRVDFTDPAEVSKALTEFLQ